MDDHLKIFLYLSVFIWLIPIFRQYKTKYFFFFLVFGIDDLVAIGTIYFIVPNSYLIFITTNYLVFLSFFKKEYLKKGWYIFLLIYLLMASIWFLTDNWEYHALIQALTHIYLLFVFAHDFVLELSDKKFNIFILVIISYLFLHFYHTVILLIFEYATIYHYLYFADFIEIFVGLFFIIFRADNDKLSIKL
ncbi:MAG: hypothetical protein PVH88_11050 [Ignavibacteria bacterium]|jgi:hypothetical protein